jgi:cellulose synthase/poly-beta-1,6-N-acetylglucosamine synthase-like glycosyltransferase
MVALFYISLFLVLYAVFLYIPLLWLIHKIRKTLGFPSPRVREAGYQPLISMIISVYNEENIIEEKLRNTLELDYPSEKLEVLVVSDASTDRTEQIVEAHCAERVRLVRQEERMGKSAALNQAVPLARGEVIVFSDANAMYDPAALAQLAWHFQDPTVGFVTGRTEYMKSEASTSTDTSGLYAKLELLAKRLESRMGACVGADGAIFAVRKHLFKPLAAHDINDFVIPLRVLEQGYAGLLEPAAVCREEASARAEDSFHRQVRITARTLRALFHFKHLLNPLKYPLYAFELVSHKFCKFLLPLFLILAFLTNLAILGEGVHYVVLFLLQCTFYLSACIIHFSGRETMNFRIMTYAHGFCLVCAAYLWGWIKYFSGEKYITWAPGKN